LVTSLSEDLLVFPFTTSEWEALVFWEIFAKGVALKFVVEVDATQVWVAFKFHAIHVEGLAL